MFIHSSQKIYSLGPSTGFFDILSSVATDTLSFSLAGYKTDTIIVSSGKFQKIVLKTLEEAQRIIPPRFISSTQNFSPSYNKNIFNGNETYLRSIENDFVSTTGAPKIGYSLNINKASYSNVRRIINSKAMVPPDAVRVEELVNYFNLCYKKPANNNTFNIETQLTSCPWKKKNQLLFVSVSAKVLDLKDIPPANFVFLIDVSGSMAFPNRLSLLKSAFPLFVRNLRSIDTVSIVTYGETVQTWLKPTSGEQKKSILDAIDQLESGGDTPGEQAIKHAYKLAKANFIVGGNNRIILATDGDFNVGQSTEEALDQLITSNSQTGISLTCIGVGMGNLKDSKLQIMAKKGRGNYAYIDNINEAQKVFVTELTQTMYAVADNAFINIQFNPAKVKNYRLIGFENAREALGDSASVIEGGQIGSGSSMLAIFEIIPNEQTASSQNDVKNLGNLELKYSNVNDSALKKMNVSIEDNFKIMDSLDNDLRLATAITMFALRIRGSKYFTNPSWPEIYNFTKAAINPSIYLQSEFLNLVVKSKKIYKNRKRKYRPE
jgi:Ca-activated chloride channel family protein